MHVGRIEDSSLLGGMCARIGCVRSHQIPAIPEPVSRSMPFDYIIPELEWPEFNSGDSGLEAEF